MSNNHTREEKLLKKDQAGPREVQKEVAEEIRSSAAQPLIRQPNRDRARGDWDRTGDHQDVGSSRLPEDEEGFDEKS
jgi:hypothetical protein